MTCFAPLWFEIGFLIAFGFNAKWFLASRKETGKMGVAVFAFTATCFIAASVVFFLVVEFVAMTAATGMYNRDAGMCDPQSDHIFHFGFGLFNLVWIVPFLAACFMTSKNILKREQVKQ